ncbi:hypothetical protein AMTR_s00060p00105980 [Amborella trichopoda]|uniref:Uncharacterized protein n=1 Tax=Amborella trichopoda TaxID=13333 RepID=W1NK59_AMBTC|nr:hypothetical protein AMTR_s00060p00105980 [Amborella trichopoda]
MVAENVTSSGILADEGVSMGSHGLLHELSSGIVAGPLGILADNSGGGAMMDDVLHNISKVVVDLGILTDKDVSMGAHGHMPGHSGGITLNKDSLHGGDVGVRRFMRESSTSTVGKDVRGGHILYLPLTSNAYSKDKCKGTINS